MTSSPAAESISAHAVDAVPVIGIRRIEVPDGFSVFNLEVEGTHNYCVGTPGLVAHNFKLD